MDVRFTNDKDLESWAAVVALITRREQRRRIVAVSFKAPASSCCFPARMFSARWFCPVYVYSTGLVFSRNEKVRWGCSAGAFCCSSNGSWERYEARSTSVKGDRYHDVVTFWSIGNWLLCDVLLIAIKEIQSQYDFRWRSVNAHELLESRYPVNFHIMTI